MKKALPEERFTETYTLIKDRIGDYVSKEFWKTETEGPFTIVFYRAEYTLEPEAVIVKVVFRPIDGTMRVSGLWFDSPRLRQK